MEKEKRRVPKDWARVSVCVCACDYNGEWVGSLERENVCVYARVSVWVVSESGWVLFFAMAKFKIARVRCHHRGRRRRRRRRRCRCRRRRCLFGCVSARSGAATRTSLTYFLPTAVVSLVSNKKLSLLLKWSKYSLETNCTEIIIVWLHLKLLFFEINLSYLWLTEMLKENARRL